MRWGTRFLAGTIQWKVGPQSATEAAEGFSVRIQCSGFEEHVLFLASGAGRQTDKMVRERQQADSACAMAPCRLGERWASRMLSEIMSTQVVDHTYVLLL